MGRIVQLPGHGASRVTQQTDPSASSQVPRLTALDTKDTTVSEHDVAAATANEAPDAIIERSRSEQTSIGVDGRPVICIKEKVKVWLGRKWQDTLLWLLVGTLASFALLKGREIFHVLKTIWGIGRSLVEHGQLPF